MIQFSMFFALMFAIICGGLVIAHSYSVGRITLLDWAILALGGMYGFGWLVVISVTGAGGNPTWAPWILPFEHLYLAHIISSLLLLFGVLTGWYLSPRGLRLFWPKPVKRIYFQVSRWHLSFWILLTVAIVTQGLYAHAYGGLLGQFEYSSAIRSARFDVVPPNPLSFLRPFGRLTLIAAFGFFGLWLSGYRTILIRLGFLLSFSFSIFVLYTWLGRLGFLVFLFTFPLALANYRRHHPMRLLFWAGVLFIGLLGGAYGLSAWINLKTANSLMEFLSRELSFPFGSFFAQLDSGENLWRGFYDFIVAPVYLTPSSLWISWVESISQVNTVVIEGSPKGERGVTGGIPVDLLTLGLMQCHLLGVAIVGVLFGLLLRWLQNIINTLNNEGIRAIFEANIALTIAVLGVFYAQPDLVVSHNIHWIVSAFVINAMLHLPSFSHYRKIAHVK